uniref:SPW repeat-containing protein n=1 Tax=Steinernema glaseri TaxID=37863 RepID=A0A1I7YBK6_9BILA
MSGTFEGLAACAVSSLFFGSMFVPLKRFDAGDGIFAQWVMCSAILAVGLVVNAGASFPPFHPLAMLGGMFWTIGNVTAIPIMNMIGLGMGILIWGTTNCLLGWASGRFGLFGINATVPNSPMLNYFGLMLVIVGGVMFSQIRPTPKHGAADEEDDGESDNSNTPVITSAAARNEADARNEAEL